MSVGRILTIATNVFREVIRDRVLYLIGLFALLMVAAVRLIPELAAQTETKIILDFGLAAMVVLSLVVTIFIGTGLVNKEIEKRTVYILVAKPLSRTELILGKHIGLSAVIAVLMTAMTVIYFAILSWSQISYPAGSIAIAAVFLFLEMSLLTAVGIAFGAFTSSLLATLLTFGVFLMGNLSRDLVELGRLTENAGIENMMKALYVVLPDLARLDFKNDAVYGQIPPVTDLMLNTGYALLYGVVLLSIAIAVFSRREF